MLPRTRLRRPLASLIGAWFALFSAVAPVAVPCPMGHGAHATAEDAATSAAQLTDAHAMHAEHGIPTGQQESSDTPAPLHPCDCATSCCSAPSVVLPHVPVTVATVTTAPAAPPVYAAPLVRAASRTLLLPFAQGPPA
jgi:hypothetical protein